MSRLTNANHDQDHFGRHPESDGDVLSIGPDDGSWLVVRSGDHPAVGRAARELRRYLKQMTGSDLTVKRVAPGDGGPWVALARSVAEAQSLRGTSAKELDGDAFQLHADATAMVAIGARPRAVLFAVYALLERLGCVWLGAGDDVIPSTGRLEVGPFQLTTEPEFMHRVVFEDSTYVDARDPATQRRRERDTSRLLDWIVKKRLNGYFGFRWDPADETVLASQREAARLDLEVSGGGHVLPFFLARSRFSTERDLFRMDDRGARVADGNLCVSNPESLQTIATAAIGYLEGHPDVSVLHAWGDDVRSGSWCHCPQCRTLSPVDQYLLACNSIAEGVSRTGRAIRVVMIAYMDTAWPDISVQPRADVELLFAPRSRDYGRRIRSLDNERNGWFVWCLEEWLVRGQFDSVGVFEYYSDVFLFQSMLITLPDVVIQDLEDYHGLGVRRVQMQTMCPVFTFVTQPLSIHAFADATWNIGHTGASISRRYCAAAYGPAADAMERFWTATQEASRFIARHGDLYDLGPNLDEPTRAAMHEVVLARGRLQDAAVCLSEARHALAGSSDARARRRVRNADLALRYTMATAAGLLEHYRAMWLIGLAEQTHRDNVGGHAAGGSVVAAGMAVAAIVPSTNAIPPRGLHEAIERIDLALEAYGAAETIYRGRAAKSVRSLWLDEPTGFASYHHSGNIRQLRAFRELVMSRIAEYALNAGSP